MCAVCDLLRDVEDANCCAFGVCLSFLCVLACFVVFKRVCVVCLRVIG